jgi:hypothetical protein
MIAVEFASGSYIDDQGRRALLHLSQQIVPAHACCASRERKQQDREDGFDDT